MCQLNVLQFICPTGFYGAERWVLAVANNFNADNVRCDLVVTKESDDQNLDIVEYYPENGGKVFTLEMSGRFDISVIKNLCHLIKERDIDVIHTHGYKSDILGFIAAKKTGIKTVSTPHGFGTPLDLKLKLFIALGCFSLRFFDKVVPLSKQLMQECRAVGIKDSKLQYVQNAVDLKEVDYFLEQRIEERTAVASSDVTTREKNQTKIIGFVGQMIPRKNIQDILLVFNDLWSGNNELVLELLGDGESRQELEEIARNLPSNRNIHFLGFRNDRLERMKSFDLFVMTSIDEGIPRCLMESQAMQIPVAAYNIPGIDQLVEHEKSGLLARVGDTATLKSYWSKLLEDEAYANALAEAGRSFVLNQFSAKRMASEYELLFQQLCEPNSKIGAKL